MIPRRLVFSFIVVLMTLCGVVCATAEEDPGWPRTASLAGRKVTVHQPQIDKWDKYEKLEARIAIEIAGKDKDKPVLGALWLQADTVVNLDARTVTLDNVKVVKVNFPSLDDNESARAQRGIDEILPDRWPDVSLDRILANLERTQRTDRSFKGSTEVPRIFVSETPAILVQTDGDPALNPIPDTDLAFAVNTNWDLFFHAKEKVYYLLNDTIWLTTTDFVQGSWKAATSLPKDFNKLPDDKNWESVRSNLPFKKASDRHIPKVFVSTKPAELIVIEGEPTMVLIEGTRVSAVERTDADLFFYDGDKRFYFLVSGRWLRADGYSGPWSVVAGDLPADFAKIPEDGRYGHILASVPGTREASEALIQSEIPQKAVVKRKEGKATVAYEGDPKFEPIKGTSMKYAVNSASDVIFVNGKYYLCDNGVWFVSASSTGPWEVADEVPREVYTIPEDSPVYRTTYVQVYDATPEEVVVGYTAGYLGCYPRYGVPVFGTGFYYPPYLWWRAGRPIFFPRPYSYGFRAYYNPATGAFARAGVVYGPYRGIGRGAVYNPAAGTYARGTVVWGPRGAAWAGVAYTPATGWVHGGGSTFGPKAKALATNPYARWGAAVGVAGTAGLVGLRDRLGKLPAADRARVRDAAQRLSDVRGGEGIRDRAREAGRQPTKTPGSGQLKQAGQGSGNLFVGPDGNLYRQDQEGWSRYGKNRAWEPMSSDRDKPGTGEAERPRDQQSRAQSAAAQEARSEQVRRKEAEQRDRRLRDEARQRDRALSDQRLRDQQRRTEQAPPSAARTSERRPPQSRDAVTSGLNREASARARGQAMQTRSAQARTYQQPPRMQSGATRGGFQGGGRRR